MGNLLSSKSCSICVYLCLFLIFAASNSFAKDKGKKEYWINKLWRSKGKYTDGSIILAKNGLAFCYKEHSPEEGDARIAFVVGHELAKKPEMLLAKEIQADQYGIIYATLAGYNSDEIISEDKDFFLEWAKRENPYTHFGKDILLLSKKRSKAVSMRLKEVSERIVLFQLGVISCHIGRYDDALSLFNRFASYFPGREVYSNVGIIYLRLAYEKFLSSRTPESFPFLLSFGRDVKTRVDTIDISRGFTEGRYREYKKLVRIAIENLKHPIEFTDAYISVLSKKLDTEGIMTFNKKHFNRLDVNLYPV